MKKGRGCQPKGSSSLSWFCGGCSFEQLPCFGILSDAPGGLVRPCVGVVGGPCEGDIELFDKVQKGLRSMGENPKGLKESSWMQAEMCC